MIQLLYHIQRLLSISFSFVTPQHTVLLQCYSSVLCFSFWKKMLQPITYRVSDSLHVANRSIWSFFTWEQTSLRLKFIWIEPWCVFLSLRAVRLDSSTIQYWYLSILFHSIRVLTTRTKSKYSAVAAQLTHTVTSGWLFSRTIRRTGARRRQRCMPSWVLINILSVLLLIDQMVVARCQVIVCLEREGGKPTAAGFQLCVCRQAFLNSLTVPSVPATS